MKIAEYFLCLFILEVRHVISLNLTPSAIVKTLHKGAYEAVKGTINTVTEVVGTPVDIKDVHFFLHTSKDQGYPNHTVDPLHPAEIATKEGRVYFLIHGWTQSRDKTPWYRPLTEYLLRKHPEAHVVQIDWGKAAANNYASAAFCTESVGNIIGDVIKKLVVDHNVPKKNVIVIGHSLGGQISGWVGKRFRKLTKTTLPRIIALDPAGPLFLSRPEEKRLNKHDADIVMVLHSDGGKLGFGSSCGSIDFFPNGGSDQPGCYKVDLADVSTLTEPIWCDHQRGYDLFLEAIKSPCLFLAKKCKDYDKFKENQCENIAVSLGDLEASSAGSYYFKTTDKAPFIEVDELKRNGRKHTLKNSLEDCSHLLKLEDQSRERGGLETMKVHQNHNRNETLNERNTNTNGGKIGDHDKKVNTYKETSMKEMHSIDSNKKSISGGTLEDSQSVDSNLKNHHVFGGSREIDPSQNLKAIHRSEQEADSQRSRNKQSNSR